MSVTVTGTNQVTANLKAEIERLRAAALAAMQEIAELLEAHAKANHPWQNETGDTENTTQAAVTEATSELIKVTLSAGTDYAKFLELARDGKWAWLWPTLVDCENQIKTILIKHLGARRVGNFKLERDTAHL